MWYCVCLLATAVVHADEAEPDEFEVFVGKEDFKFSCSHFVAFDGYRERLHGHNYSVGVRLTGQVRLILK